jgi:DNA-binding response OmpR family regulator
MSKKILVIEDDNILQKAIKMQLEGEGFVVAQAYNGEDGYYMIEKEKPDLILLDLIMPVKTGEWLLKQMNNLGLMDKYPLIVLTAKNDTESVNECIINLNVKNYLFKGDYSLELLTAKIKELLK